MRVPYAKTVSTALMLTLAAACSSSVSDPPKDIPLDPQRITEQIKASSTDGVLFDLKLTGTVLDSDSDGSFRDDIELVSPDSTEFQGHFPDPEGDMLIVSCFAPEGQTPERSATFEVSYWALR